MKKDENSENEEEIIISGDIYSASDESFRFPSNPDHSSHYQRRDEQGRFSTSNFSRNENSSVRISINSNSEQSSNQQDENVNSIVGSTILNSVFEDESWHLTSGLNEESQIKFQEVLSKAKNPTKSINIDVETKVKLTAPALLVSASALNVLEDLPDIRQLQEARNIAEEGRASPIEAGEASARFQCSSSGINLEANIESSIGHTYNIDKSIEEIFGQGNTEYIKNILSEDSTNGVLTSKINQIITKGPSASFSIGTRGTSARANLASVIATGSSGDNKAELRLDAGIGYKCSFEPTLSKKNNLGFKQKQEIGIGGVNLKLSRNSNNSIDNKKSIEASKPQLPLYLKTKENPTEIDLMKDIPVEKPKRNNDINKELALAAGVATFSLGKGVYTFATAGKVGLGITIPVSTTALAVGTVGLAGAYGLYKVGEASNKYLKKQRNKSYARRINRLTENYNKEEDNNLSDFSSKNKDTLLKINKNINILKADIVYRKESNRRNEKHKKTWYKQLTRNVFSNKSINKTLNDNNNDIKTYESRIQKLEMQKAKMIAVKNFNVNKKRKRETDFLNSYSAKNNQAFDQSTNSVNRLILIRKKIKKMKHS